MFLVCLVCLYDASFQILMKLKILKNKMKTKNNKTKLSLQDVNSVVAATPKDTLVQIASNEKKSVAEKMSTVNT